MYVCGYFQTNVAGSSRRSHRKIAYFRMCGPLLLGIIGILIVGILYWLYFDLRQQLYDYRQKMEEGACKALYSLLGDASYQLYNLCSVCDEQKLSGHATEMARDLVLPAKESNGRHFRDQRLAENHGEFTKQL